MTPAKTRRVRRIQNLFLTLRLGVLAREIFLKSLGRFESRSLFLPTFFVFGQLIGEFDPTELATRPCVVPWRQPVRFIKAARRDVDFVKEVFVLEGQLRAALRTETSRAFCRRPKPGGLTAHKPELRPRHAEPRDERSARGPTADRAVAVCLMKGRAACLVTDPPAKTSAFQHCIGLLDHGTSVILKIFLSGRRMG